MLPRARRPDPGELKVLVTPGRTHGEVIGRGAARG